MSNEIYIEGQPVKRGRGSDQVPSEDFWKAIKVSMTIVGTTIGAGFASGREIWEFFGSYGEDSHWGMILSMILFFLSCMNVLTISWKYKTNHYSELFVQLMGNRLTKIFDGLVLLYLFTTTIVMFAGSGATFTQWDRSFIEGVIVMVVAVSLVLFFDIKGLIAINLWIIPLLITGLLLVCIQSLSSHEPIVHLEQSTHLQLPIWPSAITYTAFNTISLVAVLSTMGKEIKNQVQIWLSSGISVLCLTIIGFVYNYSLLKIEHLMTQYEIPLFALVKDYSPFITFLITCVLWFAIYTTVAGNLHGLVFRLSARFPLSRWLLGLIILLILIPFSQFGFSSLVQILYPLFGVLNLFLLAVILLFPLK